MALWEQRQEPFQMTEFSAIPSERNQLPVLGACETECFLG